MSKLSPATILKRWDAIAYAQLCEVATQLAAANETLEQRVSYAEDAAESWRDDFLALCETTSQRPGISIDGHLAPAHL